MVCHHDSDTGVLLLCDECDDAYHTYCLDPPLRSVPEGAWYCPRCVEVRLGVLGCVQMHAPLPLKPRILISLTLLRTHDRTPAGQARRRQGARDTRCKSGKFDVQ